MKTGKIQIAQQHLDEVIRQLPSLRIIIIIPEDEDRLMLVAEHDDFETNDSLFVDAMPEYNIVASKHPDGHYTNYRVERVLNKRIPTNGDVWQLHPSDLDRRLVTLVQYISEGQYVLLQRSANCLNMIGGRFTQDELAQYLANADAEFMGNCNDVSAFEI